MNFAPSTKLLLCSMTFGTLGFIAGSYHPGPGQPDPEQAQKFSIEVRPVSQARVPTELDRARTMIFQAERWDRRIDTIIVLQNDTVIFHAKDGRVELITLVDRNDAAIVEIKSVLSASATGGN